jgi:hypothetical protein
MEAMVEESNRGLLRLGLRRGGSMVVGAQKGLSIGDRAIILFEPYSGKIAEVYTMSEWEHMKNGLPIPTAEVEEDYSPTEDSMPDMGDDIVLDEEEVILVDLDPTEW